MLTAQNISLSYGSRVILDDVSLTLMPKDRVALVGQNGAGKSSLLNILAGAEPDKGKIEKPAKDTLGFLQQVPHLDKNLTVLQTVRLGLAHHIALISEHQNLCNQLGQAPEGPEGPEGPRHDQLMAKIAVLSEKIDQKGGFDTDYLVSSVLSRLGVKAKEQSIGSLSGGERRRVDLARILLQSPDIYLLDEPTNHLDISAIEFLVEFFTKSNSAILFVSHDRLFIDELATRILELERGKIYWHEPPFANYLENKVIRELIDEQTLHRRERLMVNELAWLRSGTPARTTKQNARIDRAHELMENIVKDSADQRVKKLELATANKRLGNTILELDHVGIKIGERILFKDFSLKVMPGRRYGILGPNGVGKTSFLSILAGQPPSFGQVIWGKNTKILKLDQHREQLDPNATLKETLADHGEYVHIDGQNIHIASYLERYLFSGNDMNRRVSGLSGGEQNRLLLAKIFRHSANCLLLDEPTNDLDISSLAVLEEVLLDYDGVVFCVSHDRGFLDRVCNAIIAFEPSASPEAESMLTVYTGNFSSYLEQKAQVKILPVASKKMAAVKPERMRAKKKRSFKEEEELKNMEGLINSLESERSSLHEELSRSDLFKDRPELIEQKIKRLGSLDQEIDRLYKRWQELHDIGG